MAEKKPLKISYCTTCKGRLHHLKHTLPANIAAEKDNPNVEFVVLDYGSEDGLGDWIKKNFQTEIASGRLRYARYEAPHFNYAHSRNMAHRLAKGDVLCNVDADNYIAPNFSHWLSAQFEQDNNAIVSINRVSLGDDTVYKLHRLVGAKAPLEGSYGRVAISKTDFEFLKGYDERLSGWASEDHDLTKRAVLAGMSQVYIPRNIMGSVIAHGNDERLKFSTPEDRAKALKRLAEGRLARYISEYRRILRKTDQANPDGNVGCGTVHVNFSPEPAEIKPLAKAGSSQQPPESELENVVATHRTGFAAGVNNPSSLAERYKAHTSNPRGR